MYDALAERSLDKNEKWNPLLGLNPESFSGEYIFKNESDRKKYLISMTGQWLNDAIEWLQGPGKDVQDAQKMLTLLREKKTNLAEIQSRLRVELWWVQWSTPAPKAEPVPAPKAEPVPAQKTEKEKPYYTSIEDAFKKRKWVTAEVRNNISFIMGAINTPSQHENAVQWVLKILFDPTKSNQDFQKALGMTSADLDGIIGSHTINTLLNKTGWKFRLQAWAHSQQVDLLKYNGRWVWRPTSRPTPKPEASKPAAQKPQESQEVTDKTVKIQQEALRFMENVINGNDFIKDFTTTQYSWAGQRKLVLSVKDPFNYIFATSMTGSMWGAKDGDIQLRDNSLIPHAYETVLKGESRDAWRKLRFEEKQAILVSLNAEWETRAWSKIEAMNTNSQQNSIVRSASPIMWWAHLRFQDVKSWEWVVRTPTPAPKPAPKPKPEAPQEVADKKSAIQQEAVRFMENVINGKDFVSDFATAQYLWAGQKKLTLSVKDPFGFVIFPDTSGVIKGDIQLRDNSLITHAYETVLKGESRAAWRKLSFEEKQAILAALNKEWEKRAQEKLVKIRWEKVAISDVDSLPSPRATQSNEWSTWAKEAIIKLQWENAVRETKIAKSPDPLGPTETTISITPSTAAKTSTIAIPQL